jgi:4-amino-4-deoxy-L-arabinose transferase-like glycosyltransferase
MTAFFRRHGFLITAVAITLVAGALRYAWIVSAHPYASADDFRERYVYSDMGQYWSKANDFWHGDGQWSDAELLFPPGTETVFALALGPDMDRVGVFQALQWVLAMGIFAGTGLLAHLLYGRRVGIAALAIAAVCFPLFDYAAYALSETPFSSLLLAGALCAALSLKRGPWWLLAAGVCFGLATSFKSIGLIAGVFLLPAVLLAWEWPVRQRIAGAALFSIGLCMAIVPVSLVMTARNDGRFMLLSNDALRVAMANHGDLMGVKATFPDGSAYEVGSPVSWEKGFREIREIDVDVTDVHGENLAWVMAHPLRAVLDFGVRLYDMAYGTHPFPTNGTSFRPLGTASQLFTLLFILFPALAWMLMPTMWHTKTAHTKTLLLLLPVLSLVAVALIAATEPRYLHPFLPFLIPFAAMAYVPRLKASAAN